MKRKISLSLAVAPVEWDGPQDQPHRHPRLRRLHGRGRGRPERRRPGRVRGQRGRRRRGADRGHLAAVRRARPAPHGLRQQGGQGAGRLPPGAGPAPGHVRFGLRAARAAHRRGGHLPRRGRRALGPGLRVRARRQAPRRADAGRTWRKRSTASTTSSSRRSSPATTSSSSATCPARCPSVEELERTLAHEVLEGTEFPVAAGLGAHGRRRRPPGRLHLRDRPFPGRPARHRPGRRPGGAPSPPTRPASRWPSCSARSPTPSSASSRCSRCCRAPSRPTTTSSTSPAAATSACTACSTCGARSRRPPPRCAAGDLGAVAKLAGTHTGDTLAPKGSPVRVAASTPPPAVLAIAVRPRTQADDDKLGGALQRLQAEDPALVVERNEETRQTLLRGVGETHLVRVARAAGPQVRRERRHRGRPGALPGDDLRPGGGRGQGQEADRRARPVRGGQPAGRAGRPRRGLQPSSTRSSAAPSPASTSPPSSGASRTPWPTGGVHGFPVVDVKVQCYDGKYHNVDSSEMAFRTAASVGFKDALAKAGVVVLEPVSLLTVRVPAAYQGDVMGDINSRRGRVQGTRTDGGDVGGHRPRADRGDPPLRHRSALDDRRSRAASSPPTTTTTSCPAT